MYDTTCGSYIYSDTDLHVTAVKWQETVQVCVLFRTVTPGIPSRAHDRLLWSGVPALE